MPNRSFTAIIKETLNIYKKNGTGEHKKPDQALIESFDKTKEAADNLTKISKQYGKKVKSLQLT